MALVGEVGALGLEAVFKTESTFCFYRGNPRLFESTPEQRCLGRWLWNAYELPPSKCFRRFPVDGGHAVRNRYRRRNSPRRGTGRSSWPVCLGRVDVATGHEYKGQQSTARGTRDLALFIFCPGTVLVRHFGEHLGKINYYHHRRPRHNITLRH